ncbi:MAG: ABC transporter ATP-binding protein [Oscillospiraceae bacterium]|nr:ABC transporter ATP-binding protein [Oscillospiraceae bacterium]
MAVIECKNVSIRYKTGDLQQIGLKDYIIKKVTHTYKVEEFWADRDITFSVDKGDMLGIVGTNGAGKSTLLKAVTGIMRPTKGSVYTDGKVAALLELASGFDPELTVRENTFLRGALLGYTKEFMERKYNEIIAFAELEEFQDYMFKQLSSGMKSRLAFSIACLVEPDILILDEVLSVGDEAFKEKSARRIKGILANGVTGVLISHSVQQIRDLCNKCLWLDHGKQVAFGPTSVICNAYSAFLFTPTDKRKLPETEEELLDVSNRFRIAWRIGERERAHPENFPYEIDRNEPEPARIQRLMKIVDGLSVEERRAIEDELDGTSKASE